MVIQGCRALGVLLGSSLRHSLRVLGSLKGSCQGGLGLRAVGLAPEGFGVCGLVLVSNLKVNPILPRTS